MSIGRETEKKVLTDWYEKQGCHLLVIYGAKGTGKMQLITEFAEQRAAACYVCRDCGDREQRRRWRQELARQGKILPQFPEWSDILEAASEKKDILVLEEFPFLEKTGDPFWTALEQFMRTQSQKEHFLILLVSSSIRWVENDMVRSMKKSAALLSGLLKVKPLDYLQIRQLLPETDEKSRMILYGLTGGYSGRWTFFHQSDTLEDIMEHQFLAPSSPLREESIRILLSELRELNVYQTILGSMASGNNKLNDIYLMTGFPRAKISVYLKNMMEMEIVEKVFSIETLENDKTQKGLYRISDPLIQFYFTFLYPNLSALRVMEIPDFYREYVMPYLEHYTAGAFRKSCLEYLIAENRKGRLPFQALHAGEWIGKKAALDIVLTDDNGHSMAGYCNWEKKVLTAEDLEWLLYSTGEAGLKPECLWLFSAAEFEDRLKSMAETDQRIRLVRLEDITEASAD